MPLESDSKDIFGNLIPDFGIDGGLASYLPGQESAFNPEAIREILSGAIQEGLSGISPMIGGKTEDEIAQDVADFLSKNPDFLGTIAGSTVGSNQMLDDASLAAAQAASQAAADAAAQEKIVDLTADTTASTVTDDLGDESLGDSVGAVDQGTVSDVNEEWTYDASTNTFVSSTRGDRVANEGSVNLEDGAVYAVTPVLGTDGVAAENVVDTVKEDPKTNIVLTGAGLVNDFINSKVYTVSQDSTVDRTTTNNGAGANSTTDGTGGKGITDGTNGTTDTLTGGSINGQNVVLGPSVTNTNEVKTLTGGSINNNNVVKGADGAAGRDGTNGTDGKDGKDGRDGMIGLFSAITSQTPITESILFKPRFTKLDNIPQGMFEAFLRATGGR